MIIEEVVRVVKANSGKTPPISDIMRELQSLERAITGFDYPHEIGIAAQGKNWCSSHCPASKGEIT